MSKETKTTSHKPAFYAYTVKDREGKDAIWTKIGAAFPHQDGKGFTVQLEALPVGDKLTLRVPSEKVAE
jgi:hypothetical protein